MKITRRSAMGILASTAAAAATDEPQQPPADSSVSIAWLGGAGPGVETGVSWGVPWARGTVGRTQTFTLTASDGKSLPLQAWPLAWWPDGSVKFTGFATVTGAAGPSRPAPGTPATGPAAKVTQSAQAIDIDTGKLQCRIAKQGPAFLETMTIDGRVVARDGRLVCMLEDRSAPGVLRFPEFTSSIQKVTVEQTGPVRAVVKIEGMHQGTFNNSAREWLPFTVRLYFYRGTEPVRLVHTIVFDGDHEKDFIKGLGVAFAVPMREQVHNRHVRFAGEGDGLLSEPAQPLTGRRPLQGNPYADQLAGKRIANKETFNAGGQKLIADWAVWDDFKLAQTTADGFTIQKRTNPQSCWLDAIAGRRASGLVFAGDVSGGLAVGVKNFWQSYPASLEVRHLIAAGAEWRVWLWSPEAPAMDLRHYDTRAHNLDSSYEDVQPGFSTPHGVARTDRKSTRLNSSHLGISYAVFCLKKKKNKQITPQARS